MHHRLLFHPEGIYPNCRRSRRQWVNRTEKGRSVTLSKVIAGFSERKNRFFAWLVSFFQFGKARKNAPAETRRILRCVERPNEDHGPFAAARIAAVGLAFGKAHAGE